MELLNRSEPASHIAMWDSLLVSATRVGDTQTVLDAARAAPLLLPDGSPNLLHRLQLHLALAAKLPGLSEIADVHLDIPPHPLRRPDLIPHNPAHLV